MRNQNPVFATIQTGATHFEDVDAASYKGVVIKTSILLIITIAVAVITALALPRILASNVVGLALALTFSGIIGFIAALIGRISFRAAMYGGIIYSVCQGLFLGTISALCEFFFPGVGVGTIAAFSTALIFGVMLLLYATGVFRQGSILRKLAYAMSIGALVLILFVSLFGLFMPAIYNNFGIMLFIELFLLIYGAITLIFNFDEANYVVAAGCEKKAEWSVSLGLIVSLIYIYVQVLYFLILIFGNSNRN